DKNRGLLELRTYESYNEDAGRRKIKMFNDEELPLFEKLGLHPVFFGQLLAGRFMPALVYMLWFKDMEERAANWGKFGSSDEWKTMRVKEEYANTVSKVKKVFLTPADFSQI
ncbi:MAG: NIPSNAP family containing protein, partial [Prolixibacteraceae bacterium]|nr:NIPSNAP family containing protein [Prolixibacteraceae bacterium]